MSSTLTFAQTQTTENYLVTGPWNDYVVPMKYSYTVSNEGERIKNGPIIISGSQNEQYGNVTITGSYNLSASAKEDKMNGAISINAKYHGVKQLYRGQQVEDYVYSLSGNFSNGVPNGTFTAKATNFGSSTATYKNGTLIGAYSVNETIDERIVNIKGAFNDGGKMIGEWRFEVLGDMSTWEMVNGIRIRISSRNQESTPEQIAMAKKYASGVISERELEKEGYVAVQDSIRLGDYANDLYFLKFIADWEKLPEYTFEKSFWVKYIYLYNILPVPDNVFLSILDSYKNNGECCYPLVEYDKLAKSYTVQYPVNNKVIKRRFTNEQISQIRDAIDYYCRNNPLSIGKLYSLENNTSLIYPDKFESQFNTIKTKNNVGEAILDIQSLSKKIETVKKAIIKQIDGKEKTSDGLYYIVPVRGRWSQPLTVRYFAVSALERFNTFSNEVNEYKHYLDNKYKEEAINSINSALKGIENQSKSNLIRLLNNATQADNSIYSRFAKPNSITIEELSKAIAPVTEYKIVSFVNENPKLGFYNVTVEFKTVKKGQEIITPVTMSITEQGKIIARTIVLNR